MSLVASFTIQLRSSEKNLHDNHFKADHENVAEELSPRLLLLVIASTSSGQEVVSITDTGDLGVGTDTPFGAFQVIRNDATDLRIAQFTNATPAASPSWASETAPVAQANKPASIALQSSTVQRVAGRFICNFIDTNDATRTGAFKFFVANNGGLLETMRLTGGRVSIGTSNATHLLRVGNATCNGSVWANASSRELKQDITPLTTAAALKR
ncbi:MAG: hypothetical protein R3B90_08695 [Planctomycetaceae bacterium]